MKPFVSQLVHFIDTDDAHCAAMIVSIDRQEVLNADTKETVHNEHVNLVVWNAFGGHSMREGVTYDATAKKPGTWHFVEENAAQAIPDTNAGASSPSNSLPVPDKATGL